jgi:long-subunit acyl-CoA synthetase (AMP-forming)
MTADFHDWLPRGPTVALDDGTQTLSFDDLHAYVAGATAWLKSSGLSRVASLADNGIDWLVADLAMLQAGIVHVPLPGFFTPAQVAGALRAAGAEGVLLGPAAPLQMLLAAAQGCSMPGATTHATPIAGLDRLQLVLLTPEAKPQLPVGTAKVTFTSGSTGAPKGVCLGAEGLLRVVAGVHQATRPLGIRQHLCALPLAVLLENTAGAMVALSKGATVHLRPAAALGWRGAAGFDAALLDGVVRDTGAESLILMPQMLRAWTAHLGRGHGEHSGSKQSRGITGDQDNTDAADAPDTLRFVAVGGAAVGAQAILAARAVGLPAFEGYGLSEGSSVQTLNLPGADRPGSAGRPLPHARIHTDNQAQLHVSGSLMLGYIGHAPLAEGGTKESLATGDVGEVDADGFVWVRGRLDNLLITGLGRNVSPEWVESLLRESTCVAEAVVLPDSQGGLRAVVWPAAGTAADTPDPAHATARQTDTNATTAALHAAIDTAVTATNARLPDYARLSHWTLACRPLDAASGLATPSGKPLRAAIAAAHPGPAYQPLDQLLDQPLHPPLHETPA